MKITNSLTINDLKKMAADMFGNFVKAVIDIDRKKIVAVVNLTIKK